MMFRNASFAIDTCVNATLPVRVRYDSIHIIHTLARCKYTTKKEACQEFFGENLNCGPYEHHPFGATGLSASLIGFHKG